MQASSVAFRVHEVPMPRTLRTAFCTAALVSLLTSSSATAGTQAEREAALLDAVNRTRAAHGLQPLRLDARLQLAARRHSGTMLRHNTFAHGSVRARLASYGAQGPRFGENLAWGVGSRAAATSIVRLWLSTPSHRANLLRPGFRRVGIGAMTGTFAGYRGATVVTADFAGS
jgi:uncharacterized protein YkwD